MCALIQTRVSLSLFAPVFSVRIFFFLDFPLKVFAVIYPPVPWKEWSTRRSWAEFLVWQLLGFVCFYYKPQSMLTSPTIPRFVFTPLTQTKRRRSPFLFPFFAQLRSLHSFLLSKTAKEVKIREKFVILVLKISSSVFKVEFLSLATEYLFTEKYWEFLELQTYQATSQALPGWAVTKAASDSEFYVVFFFYCSEIIKTDCNKDSILDFNWS